MTTVKKKLLRRRTTNGGLHKLREVWTKTFKSSAAAEDDVQEDDVEMTVEGGVSSVGAPSSCRSSRRMSLRNRCVLAMRRPRNNSKPQQHQDMSSRRLSINWRSAYISNDKFNQEDIFHYWDGRLSGHAHVNQTYPDVVRMWRLFHGCPASGGGIE